MSTPKKFTRAEVETHVESLNHLLKDVGPEISKALTQLVLNKPAASKQEALEFLATHLAASSAPGDVDLIKAVKADEAGDNTSNIDTNLTQAAIEHGAAKPARDELEVITMADAQTKSADVTTEPQPVMTGSPETTPVAPETPAEAPAGGAEAEPLPTSPVAPTEAVQEAAPAAVEPAADTEPQQLPPEAPLPRENVEKLSPIGPIPQDVAAAESFQAGPTECQAEAAGAGAAPAIPAVQPQEEVQQAAIPEANAEAISPVLDQQGEAQAAVEALEPTTMPPQGEAPAEAVETTGSSTQAAVTEDGSAPGAETAPDTPLPAADSTPAEASLPEPTEEEPAVFGLDAKGAAGEETASLPAVVSGEGASLPAAEPAQEKAAPVPVEEPARGASPLHAENPAEMAPAPVPAIEPAENAAPVAVVPAEELPSAAQAGEVVSQVAEQACTTEEAPAVLPAEEGAAVTAGGPAPHTTEGDVAATPAIADGVTDQQPVAKPATGAEADTQGLTAAVEGDALGGTPAVE
ncbi:hypothetical protein N2152v2_009360 [Parachlorella kessleri]